MVQTGEFLPASYYLYTKNLSETEWLDTQALSKLVKRTRSQTSRVLLELRKLKVVDCKVDTNFQRSRYLWRLKPEGLS